MCFEILGFDIFIDKNHKPWLLECNLSPSFNSDSEFDVNIKAPLILESFELISEKFRRPK